MKTNAMPKADFVTGILLFLTGIYMVLEGMRMPPAGGFIEAGGEPGRVPILLGCILSLLSGLLIVRSTMHGGHRLSNNKALSKNSKAGLIRSTLTAAGCSLYALGLLGSTFLGLSIRYDVATMLFLLVFILAAEWSESTERELQHRQASAPHLPKLSMAISKYTGVDSVYWVAKIKLFITALLQAVIVSFTVTYLFEQQFFVKLP